MSADKGPQAANATPASEAGSSASGPSAGTMLRLARERQGLHLAALAAAIKVTPRKIEALEQDRLDELPDATFARALAASICRTLKTDPKPILDALPKANTLGRARLPEPLNQPLNPTSVRDHRGAGSMAWAGKPLWVAAALLALGAAIVFAVPTPQWQVWRDAVLPQPAARPAATTGADAATGAPLPQRSASGMVVTQPVPSGEPAAPAASGATSATSALGATSPVAAASEPQAVAAPQGVPNVAIATAPIPAPIGSAPAGQFGAAPTTVLDNAAATPAAQLGASAVVASGAAVPFRSDAMLQLRLSEPSWVEVRDVNNRALIARMVPADSLVGLDGAAPLSVIIGNASAAQLRYRGQDVDLSKRTRSNVARLDLN